MELSIAQPDDWHLHLRDGDLLEAVISHRFYSKIDFFQFSLDGPLIVIKITYVLVLFY